MSSNKGTSGAVEGLVYDFYVLAIEGILQERRGILTPLGSSTENYSDNSDYNRQSLVPWRRDISKLLILDLYIFSTKHNKHILLERWKINYQRNNDSKDSRPFPIINRRILTLVRTIICFIRLLPAFNLLNQSKIKPSLGYQIYEGRNDESLPLFSYDCLKYRFNQVSTSKGNINLGVTYVNPSSVKELIRSLNNNGTSVIRTSKDSEKSAAIPIPVQSKPTAPSTPDYNSYPASRHRPSGSYEQQQQRIDEYEDQFDSNNNSYSEGHQRRLHQQQSEDLRRRSLQQPHAGRGHSNSEEGPGFKVRGSGQMPPPQPSHQQAVSLDHYNSKHSMQHYPFDASPPQPGVAPLGTPNMSPSSATATAQYLQSYSRHTPNAAHGRGGQHPPSNASSQSTPPFSLLDRVNDIMNTYPDPTKASPPYTQFSTSLVSTSPAPSSSMQVMLEAFRTNRRRSFSERTSNSASTGTSWQQQPHLATLAVSPNGLSEELRLLVTLPRSPFLRLLAAGEVDEQARTLVTQPVSDGNRLDVILYEEKRQQQRLQLGGWGGSGLDDNPSKYIFNRSAALCSGGETDLSDESSRQFRLSDERGRTVAQHLDFGDTIGSDADRLSLHAGEEGEHDHDDEEEDMMFAFALNPHELPRDSDELLPSAPNRLLVRRDSLRSTLTDTSGNTFSTQVLKEELQARLNVFRVFKAELK